MADVNVEKILDDINALPPNEQQLVREELFKKRNGPEGSAAGPSATRTPLFGWAKQLITISPDFDEPVADFQEYAE